MPSINIMESDSTLVTARTLGNVVFIPGFVSPNFVITSTDFPARGEIVTVTDLSLFYQTFGQVVPQFTSDQNYTGTWSTGETGVQVTGDSQDLGYLLARTLLQKGLSVAFTYANTVYDGRTYMGAVTELPEEGLATEIYQLIATDPVGRAPGGYIYDSTNSEWTRIGSNYLAAPTIVDMYSLLGTIYDDFLSKVEGANISHITSGGYPVFGYSYQVNAGAGAVTVDMVVTMLAAAAETNSVAVIDHTNVASRALIGASSIFGMLQEKNYENGQYGTMFTPWSTDSTTGADVPASFHYLYRLADAVSNDDKWLAIAGVTRGRVYADKLLTGTNLLTNKVANLYTADDNIICLNAITNISPYGLTIWGNRTLANYGGNIKATSFLNIRNIVNDIKKVAYEASTSLMFEQNNEILWINFKAKMSPTLETLVTGYGIQKYTMTKETSTDKKKLKAKITLYPIYAVEAFEITIELKDDDATTTSGGQA